MYGFFLICVCILYVLCAHYHVHITNPWSLGKHEDRLTRDTPFNVGLSDLWKVEAVSNRGKKCKYEVNRVLLVVSLRSFNEAFLNYSRFRGKKTFVSA